MTSSRRLAGVTILVGLTSCVPREHDATSADRTLISLDTLFAAAQDVYFSGRYDSATTLLEAIRADARTEGDVAQEARAITWLGLSAWRLSPTPGSNSPMVGHRQRPATDG